MIRLHPLENLKCFAALMLGLVICAAGGCSAFPGVVKLAQPAEKPSQEHFSCGEDCPPSIAGGPRGSATPPRSRTAAKYEYSAEK